MTYQFPLPPSECRQLEALLAPFVDGCATPEATRTVDAHLERCGACREAVDVQRAVRALLVGRRSALAEPAPAALSAAIGRVARPTPSVQPARPWVSPLAAAAAVVLTVGLGAVWATGRSSVLLAAQLTLDHLKCFVIDGADHEHALAPATAEVAIRREFDDPTLALPSLPGDGRARLVAVRDCLYGDGWVPHALYRVDGQPVSLFVLRGSQPAPVTVDAFGKRATIVTQAGSSYLLVAPAELGEVAAAVGLGAQ